MDSLLQEDVHAGKNSLGFWTWNGSNWSRTEKHWLSGDGKDEQERTRCLKSKIFPGICWRYKFLCKISKNDAFWILSILVGMVRLDCWRFDWISLLLIFLLVIWLVLWNSQTKTSVDSWIRFSTQIDQFWKYSFQRQDHC